MIFKYELRFVALIWPIFLLTGLVFTFHCVCGLSYCVRHL